MKPSMALAVVAACGAATVFARVQRLRLALAAAVARACRILGCRALVLLLGTFAPTPPVGASAIRTEVEQRGHRQRSLRVARYSPEVPNVRPSRYPRLRSVYTALFAVSFRTPFVGDPPEGLTLFRSPSHESLASSQDPCGRMPTWLMIRACDSWFCFLCRP
jgi:hypothetical protein